jgi:hypothetical protein
MCHRVLGDLDAVGALSSCSQSPSPGAKAARAHYNEALRIARAITFRPALIEALIARGRYLARTRQAVAQAFADLREALELATRGGYRRYEADARVALAWAYLAPPIPGPSPTRGGREHAMARALEEAQRAHALSEAMGYHWGRVDAEEVLGRMGNGE